MDAYDCHDAHDGHDGQGDSYYWLLELNTDHLRSQRVLAEIQLCSATRSSFLLNTHDSPRKTISMTIPMPEKASFKSFSEI